MDLKQRQFCTIAIFSRRILTGYFYWKAADYKLILNGDAVFSSNKILLYSTLFYRWIAKKAKFCFLWTFFCTKVWIVALFIFHDKRIYFLNKSAEVKSCDSFSICSLKNKLNCFNRTLYRAFNLEWLNQKEMQLNLSNIFSIITFSKLTFIHLLIHNHVKIRCAVIFIKYLAIGKFLNLKKKV